MWDDVRLYELEFDTEDFDLSYWLGVLDRFQPTRVLELACGAGRIPLPLAARGSGTASGSPASTPAHR